MKIPVFVRGSKANIDTAIANGEIKYPAYIWEKSSGEWWFLNENNTIEKGASHTPVTALSGTIEAPITISAIDEDGLYAVKGVYRIAPYENMTLFSTNSYVLFFIKTYSGEKRIKRIAEDEINDYIIANDTVTTDNYITEQSLMARNYVDSDTLSESIAEVEQSVKDYVDRQIGDSVPDIIGEEIDKKVVPATEDEIRSLFANAQQT